jgi:hypothetical protein
VIVQYLFLRHALAERLTIAAKSSLYGNNHADAGLIQKRNHTETMPKTMI